MANLRSHETACIVFLFFFHESLLFNTKPLIHAHRWFPQVGGMLGMKTINRNMAVAIQQGQKGHNGSHARRHSITATIL